MPTTVTKELLLDVLRDLMVAEAGYRSAMSIYKDHPSHRTRIRAESQWHHAKQTAIAALNIEER